MEFYPIEPIIKFIISAVDCYIHNINPSHSVVKDILNKIRQLDTIKLISPIEGWFGESVDSYVDKIMFFAIAKLNLTELQRIIFSRIVYVTIIQYLELSPEDFIAMSKISYVVHNFFKFRNGILYYRGAKHLMVHLWVLNGIFLHLERYVTHPKFRAWMSKPLDNGLLPIDHYIDIHRKIYCNIDFRARLMPYWSPATHRLYTPRIKDNILDIMTLNTISDSTFHLLPRELLYRIITLCL